MKERFAGLDFLRGLGIFFVVMLHSAFYYFGGLYDLDLNDPPPIVTVIGLLLMFAGMFAIISSMVHCIQMFRRSTSDPGGASPGRTALQFTVRGAVILVIAYAYFIITGPGVVDMAARTMDNSILVELIQSGRFKGVSFQRIFYIDSLVMLGMNIILLGFFSALMLKILKTAENPWFRKSLFIGGILSAALSLARIPLYSILMEALDEGDHGIFIALNWLVNKNNPILPYIAFGFFGMWMSASMLTLGWKIMRTRVLLISALFLVAGVALYVVLPDTMLERSIDMKWYSIMLAQLGLFMLMVLGALKIFDFRHAGASNRNVIVRFFTRFGVAGLTVFFLESVVSALVFRLLGLMIPGISLDLWQALVYGAVLSLVWGVLLILWEKAGYKFGLEFFYGKIVAALSGQSSKLVRLSEKTEKTEKAEK